MITLPLEAVVYGPRVSLWCLCSYPRHPDGCNNYGRKEICPPKVRVFPSMFDVSGYEVVNPDILVDNPMYLMRLMPGREPTLWFILETFDLEKWSEDLRAKNPHYKMSDAQTRIPYLWQPSLEKRVVAEANLFKWRNPSIRFDVLPRPEANEVNIFSTCAIHGVKLERNPQKTVYQVVMIGKTNKKKS